jgi:hypothetical protein
MGFQLPGAHGTLQFVAVFMLIVVILTIALEASI